MFSRSLCLGLALTSFSVLAGPTSLDCQTSTTLTEDLEQITEAMEGGCPNNRRMGEFCTSVSEHSTPHPDKGESYQYNYQSIIRESACVLPTDSEEEVQRKVQRYWSRYQNELICDSVAVENGNILKHGVVHRFDDFLFEIAKWRVDMNRVDPSDNRTVLDFIRDERDRITNRAVKRRLDRYYRRLREYGAKHQNEL